MESYRKNDRYLKVGKKKTIVLKLKFPFTYTLPT